MPCHTCLRLIDVTDFPKYPQLHNCFIRGLFDNELENDGRATLTILLNYVYMCVYTYIYICIYIYIHDIYTYIYICSCICTYIYIYVWYIHIHIHMHMFIYALPPRWFALICAERRLLHRSASAPFGMSENTRCTRNVRYSIRVSDRITDTHTK